MSEVVHKIAYPGQNVVLNPDDKWVCTCGKEHDLGPYVAAHWDILLVHKCDCGIERSFRSGILKTPNEPKQRRKWKL